MKISLCMIVRDEEAVLARCLESAKGLADELIVVDTGSRDKTKTIAARYTDLIYGYVWKDDFAAARNFAFSKATGDYLFWLDADDAVPEESRKNWGALRRLLEEEQPDVVMCPYDVAFDGGKPVTTFYRERLIRRGANLKWQGRVHECIAPQGKTVHSEIRISHLGSQKERGMRNLHIYQAWAAEEPLLSRDLFYYGRELYYHKLYTEAIAVLREMLGGDGWYINKIEACKILAQCHAAQGKDDRALCALFQSFLYGEPRAALVCDAAYIFFRQKRYREAAFWYEAALRCRDHSVEGDFEQPECRALIPLLQLTCCYDLLGETKKALTYHKRAQKLAPDHPSVIHNQKYFSQKGY